MIEEFHDGQGSLWRRWDPHVHFPGTILSNQFADLELPEALEIVSSRSPTIEAVGVTDYVTTDAYRKVAEAWYDGSSESLRLLFPNVELRLDVPTSKGHGVNLHLLCDHNEIDELDAFLATLDFNFRDKLYKAERGSLIDLGRSFRGQDLPEEAALEEGTNQFKVSFDTLKARFGASAWASQNCLVAVSGNEADGTSGVRDPDSSFAARRQEIERFCHIVFSGNPKQRQFWLGEGADSPSTLSARYGGRKLCIHGSDAHSADRLGSPTADRFTWLKGDPSFETLRQACIEPAARSHIGHEPPNTTQAHGRIAQVSVTSAGWFAQESVPINPGLVAIIGMRGSGKTALADVIAAAAGSVSPFENQKSFIRRAGSLIRDSAAAVEWTQGAVTTCDFAAERGSVDESTTPVRYLSQQFVDRLCAADGMSDELVSEIERVVFATWPVGERLGATTFDELLQLRLTTARSRKRSETDAIAETSERITTQWILKQSLAAKRTELKAQAAILEKLQVEAKDLTTRADKTQASRLAVVSTALQEREQQLQQISRRVKALESLKDAVRTARTSTFPRTLATMREAHSEAGLDDDAWLAFAITFVGDVDGIADTALHEAKAIQVQIAGSERDDDGEALEPLDGAAAIDLATKTVVHLNAEQKRLQTLAGIDAQRAKRLVALGEQSGRVRTRINQLESEVQAAEDADSKIAKLTDQRASEYAAYFDALLEEEQELNALYSPLKKILAEASDSVAKLKFAVKRTVDVVAWAERGESLLDLRKEGAFRGRGVLHEIACNDLLPAWNSGDGTAAAAAVRAFSVARSADLRRQCNVERSDDAAYRAWERQVARWLYSADHIALNYSLEYAGLDIRRLSPGLRGIVLLLLYLAVDREESIPLIIDQPEENLDPESVYTELVQLFRRASERRQVIMVTHNANLVVNTDVDQVIVASCGALETDRLPELNYLCGGLERPEIRAAVCQVLEGGEDAFRERARRLRIEW